MDNIFELANYGKDFYDRRKLLYLGLSSHLFSETMTARLFEDEPKIFNREFHGRPMYPGGSDSPSVSRRDIGSLIHFISGSNFFIRQILDEGPHADNETHYVLIKMGGRWDKKE